MTVTAQLELPRPRAARSTLVLMSDPRTPQFHKRRGALPVFHREYIGCEKRKLSEGVPDHKEYCKRNAATNMEQGPPSEKSAF